MIQSEEISELQKALDEFHKRTSLVKATKENPFLKNKYADYNTVVAETREDLQAAGLRVKQTITNVEGKTAIYTRLTHLESGQFMADTAPVAHKETDPQSQGSGITYMKRYSYIAMLDILVDADDDGNVAAGIGKAVESSKEVDKIILKLQKASSEDELKKTFLASGKYVKDARVIAAKDERKKELDL